MKSQADNYYACQAEGELQIRGVWRQNKHHCQHLNIFQSIFIYNTASLRISALHSAAIDNAAVSLHEDLSRLSCLSAGWRVCWTGSGLGSTNLMVGQVVDNH